MHFWHKALATLLCVLMIGGVVGTAVAALGRFVIEYFRADALGYAVLGRPFPVARTISLLAMLACLVVHARLRNRPGTPSSGRAVAAEPGRL